METRRFTAVIIALLLALSLAPAAVAQSPADPPRGQPEDGVPFGRVPEERGRSAEAPGRVVEGDPVGKLPGQPRDDVIEDVPADPDDASIPLNLIPYHEIPARLRDLQGSDRVSVEIIGESVEGRDLHLVVVTSPMSDGDWDEWQRLSDLRIDDPVAAIAALEAGEYDNWKTPLFVNNNIHGNEWEGTDGSLQVLDELAFSDDPAVLEVLDRHVLAFVVTMNPDGRIAGTRQNANGFDMNRDFITASQPETRAVRDQLVRYSPLTMLDQHGYVWPTLIEPTTGPHGDNYEYDLYIAKALRNALTMEDRILSDVGDDLAAFADERSGFTWPDRADIPYRNRTTGWDDWPPIFTPMYAMYHGTVGHTIEFPLNPRGNISTEERHTRTALNTRVVVATIEANIDYATESRDELLATQLEWFRRGVAGEPTRPIDDDLALELAAGDNAKTHLIDFPRAYVIPAGEGQRSPAAAARVVQFLIDNDVRVHRAETPFSLGGERYAVGSYVVDMHQAKRGLANTILDVGRDVTDAYPTMYDISAWSHGHLWGATVVEIPDGDLDVRLRELDEAPSTASVTPGRRPQYALEVDSVAGIQAVNFLLGEGVSLTRREDGTFVVPGSARAAVIEAAERYGVAFANLPPSPRGEEQPVQRVRLGTSAPSDEVFALNRMGFETTAVSHGAFNNGTVSFDDFDAFYVSTTTFNPNNLNATQQAAFADWLEAGGTVVGRGGSGVTFNNRANLLDVSVETGPGRANGIVAVSNDPDSPITGNALSSSFVSAPRYFTSVGENVRVDQRLEEGFFLAGHWIGHEDATGHAVVVSGTVRGANVTLFGTEPLYRAHPEGLHAQVAEALWWNRN